MVIALRDVGKSAIDGDQERVIGILAQALKAVYIDAPSEILDTTTLSVTNALRDLVKYAEAKGQEEAVSILADALRDFGPDLADKHPRVCKLNTLRHRRRLNKVF